MSHGHIQKRLSIPPAAATTKPQSELPSRVVLVMQGGALGAFQAGVYEAMHAAGIEPDWVVGTSIGAINGAIIAGNTPKHRLDLDSRDTVSTLDHVMASGALPPAFPAVVIDGEPYWDGGIYSNTPLEVVMDDNPRQDAVVFAAQLWQQEGDIPESIARVSSRLKDIQYASRATDQIRYQQQIHHLRHIVRELGRLLPPATQSSTEARSGICPPTY